MLVTKVIIVSGCRWTIRVWIAGFTINKLNVTQDDKTTFNRLCRSKHEVSTCKTAFFNVLFLRGRQTKVDFFLRIPLVVSPKILIIKKQKKKKSFIKTLLKWRSGDYWGGKLNVNFMQRYKRTKNRPDPLPIFLADHKILLFLSNFYDVKCVSYIKKLLAERRAESNKKVVVKTLFSPVFFNW